MKFFVTFLACMIGITYAEAIIAQSYSRNSSRVEVAKAQGSQQTARTNLSSRMSYNQAREIGKSLQKTSSKLGVRTALAAERLKYESQKDGSYKVKVLLGNRQQFVYVLPDRTLESVAYIALEENYIIPIGWIKELNRNCIIEGKWKQKEVPVEVKRKKVVRNALVFVFSATEAVKSKDLANAIRTVARIADEVEQELSPTDDLN